jgi:YD repeat-containing protein
MLFGMSFSINGRNVKARCWLYRDLKKVLLPALVLFFSFSCSAAVLVSQDPWHFLYVDDLPDNNSAGASCIAFAKASVYPDAVCGYGNNPAPFYAAGWFPQGGGIFYLGQFFFGRCKSPQVFNVSTANCGNDEQKGPPSTLSCVGNPINTAVGNKFQQEVDYQPLIDGSPSFSRSYNSLDGLWRHNYSTFIRFAIGKLSLVHADGRESFFNVDGDIATAYPNETGLLVKAGASWLYTADNNERFTYDSSGRLTEWSSPAGLQQKLTYNNGQVTVSSNSGQTLTFTEDAQHQPLTLATSDLRITYSYDANQHLVQLTRTRGSQAQKRQFLYEDSRNTSLLTGIIDERGIRFATWSYDDQGRAISSQHSGGAGLTQVAYNADGSSTVTNELGKTTVYRYQQIGGVKRVTAIEGEPSANCPASNSSYTYNDRGQMLTKTDAKGLVTAYTYNDRGLETSRTEASGTPLARTVTTEWDPDRFLPTKVVEPTRVTVYSYDNQGRELTRQVTSR